MCKCIALLVLLASCAGKTGQVTRAQSDFECKDRIASYTAAHHMSGDIGVQMDCVEAGPRIKRWRTDKKGVYKEDARAITAGEFDTLWKEIDGTGWTNLKDCRNGDDGPNVPMYVFVIKDDQNEATFSCQAQAMPYPYNGIVDPLDMAGQSGKQLGDDEPDDVKALDKKDMQR